MRKLFMLVFLCMLLFISACVSSSEDIREQINAVDLLPLYQQFFLEVPAHMITIANGTITDGFLTISLNGADGYRILQIGSYVKAGIYPQVEIPSSCFSKTVRIRPRPPNATYWADTTNVDITENSTIIYHKGRAFGSGANYELTLLRDTGEAVFAYHAYYEGRYYLHPQHTPRLYIERMNQFKEYLESEIGGNLLNNEQREVYRNVLTCIDYLVKE